MVSVVIPAYNAEKTISKCIRSVMAQTYKETEIIVVDDGSEDSTGQIVKAMAERCSRLRLIRQENRGAAAARNAGIKAAKGNFLMFVDADDAIMPQMIEILIKYQNKYKTDLVKSGIRVMRFGISTRLETCNKIFYYKSKAEIHNKFFELFSNGLNSPVGKLYSLIIIKSKNILFDEELELSEDLHFNLKYLEAINSAVFIPEAFYQYYVSNSFVTAKYRKNLFCKRRKAVQMLEEYLDRNKLDKNVVYYLYIKLVFAAAMQENEHNTPRKERLLEIYTNLNRREVKASVNRYVPKGLMDKALYFVICQKNTRLIDAFAIAMNFIRKHNFLPISRISV